MTDPLDRYEMIELVAVMWNDEMAQRFPNAEHTFCRCLFSEVGNQRGRCVGWHCNRCGSPTDCQGGHNCPDRPEKAA